MTLRDYIGAIVSTKIFIGGQEQLLVDLFKNAGAIIDVERDTAKSWRKPEKSNGHRNCSRIRKYFPKDTINEVGFIQFIRSRANTSWPKLQKAFHPLSEKDCIVNLHTNDPEIFYWSILNQFQKILRLPLLEMPAKRMFKLFKNAVENCEISVFFENDANFSNDADLSGMIEDFLKSLSADIIEPFNLWHSESSIYQKILELHSELESFVILHKSEIDNLMSYYRSYDDTIRRSRQRIDTLYCEICGIRPQYESMTLGSFSFKIKHQTNSE
jgi:hypothetical protein